MDITESIVKAFIDHVFLIVGLAIIFWWGTKNLLPKELRLILTNGGGEIIRKIVRDENTDQEQRQNEEFRRMIKEHELTEQDHFERLMQADNEIKLDIARHDERLKILESKVKS